MQDQTEQTLLATLADRAGIATDYYDIAGTRHVTADDTRRALLTAMGFAVDSPASLTQTLHEWDEAPWQRPCDPVRILYANETGAPLSCYLVLEDGQDASVTVEWQIRDEANTVVQAGQAGPGLSVVEVRVLQGQRHVRIELPAPQGLALGYYTVTLRAEGVVAGVWDDACSSWRHASAMFPRRSRGTNGCGDWPCSSIRCPPIGIGGAATSPISAGWWNGPGRSSAPGSLDSIRCTHCGIPRRITSAPMRHPADCISMNSISISSGCRNGRGRRRPSTSSGLPSFKPRCRRCESAGW